MTIELTSIPGEPVQTENPIRGYLPFFLRKAGKEKVILHPTASARVKPLIVLVITLLIIVAVTPPLVRSLVDIINQNHDQNDWLLLGILFPLDIILLIIIGVAMYNVLLPGKWQIDRSSGNLILQDGKLVIKTIPLAEITAVQVLLWDALDSSPYVKELELTPVRVYQLNLVLGSERYAVFTVYDDVQENSHRWLLSAGQTLSQMLQVPLATHQNWKLIATTAIISKYDTAFARDKHLQQPPPNA